MQSKQTLRLIGYYHLDDGWKELIEITDGNVTRGKRGGGADIVLVGTEVVNYKLEYISLRRHVTEKDQ
jgi:hypothetical protein